MRIRAILASCTLALAGAVACGPEVPNSPDPIVPQAEPSAAGDENDVPPPGDPLDPPESEPLEEDEADIGGLR